VIEVVLRERQRSISSRQGVAGPTTTAYESFRFLHHQQNGGIPTGVAFRITSESKQELTAFVSVVRAESLSSNEITDHLAMSTWLSSTP
jgi:hypothetical protein